MASQTSIKKFSSMPYNTGMFLSTPGKYPGVSTKKSIGMLNALQKRTKRALLSEESTVKHPAK